jgi:predicted phage terminase large subunit-like protein
MIPSSLQKQLAALQSQAIQQDFSCFLHHAVLSLNPRAVFQQNWHHQLLAEYLQAVQEGNFRRLIINIPPRHLKSLCVSVAWPAWLLAKQPAKRIIVASYASGLSLKHSLDSRTLIESEWYQELFPATRIAQGQNEKHKYLTTEQGFRFATSVGGSVTGEGGDILIVDDPLNPARADSAFFRNHTNRWFEQTFSTRLNSKKDGAIIIVMQRLHPEDLSGYLLKKRDWELLELPAIAQRTHHFITGGFDFRYRSGQALHAEREDIATLQKLRHEMGSHAFLAQYLQQPVSVTGTLVKPHWFPRYITTPEITQKYNQHTAGAGYITEQGSARSGGVWGKTPMCEAQNIYQSWDTAIKAGQQHDYSVCLTFGIAEGVHYLLEALRVKLEYPDLRRIMLSQADKWKPQAILLEDKASGQSLIQDLRQHMHLPIIPCQPRQDKYSRFAAITPMLEAGKLSLPSQAFWLAEFEAEIYAFPQCSHDDQVDALSQYFGWQQSRQSQKLMQIRRI